VQQEPTDWLKRIDRAIWAPRPAPLPPWKAPALDAASRHSDARR